MADNDSKQSKGGKPTGRKLFETLLAGLLDFMWGKGMPDIQRQLQQSTPDTLATVIGHITFALVQQGAEEGEAKGLEFDFDMLIGVATELIESLEKMAAAMNIEVDPEAVSLHALVQALNDYAQTFPDPEAARQEAQKALKGFTADDWDTAKATLSDIGAQRGVNPFAQAEQGAPTQSGPTPPGPQRSGLMGAGQ